MKVHHVNHIGINVSDLPAAIAFFTDLGFTIDGKTSMRGELLDKVTGLKDAHTEFAMLESPDGKLNLEVIKYLHPVDPEGTRVPATYTLGLSHLAFEVDDIEAIVTALNQKGYNLVGEVQTYENIWKLCYVCGPENIIVELAQRL